MGPEGQARLEDALAQQDQAHSADQKKIKSDRLDATSGVAVVQGDHIPPICR